MSTYVVTRVLAAAFAQTGKRQPETPVEVLVASFAVDLRNALANRCTIRTDRGAGYLRALADQLQRMADDIDQDNAPTLNEKASGPR